MQAVIDPSTWLSRGEVAKQLDVSPVRVDQLAAAGRIAYVVTPLGKLFNPASVEQIKTARAR